MATTGASSGGAAAGGGGGYGSFVLGGGGGGAAAGGGGAGQSYSSPNSRAPPATVSAKVCERGYNQGWILSSIKLWVSCAIEVINNLVNISNKQSIT